MFHLQVPFVLFQYISRHVDVLPTYLFGREWVKVSFTLALRVCLLVSLAAGPSFVKKIPPPPATHSLCTHTPSLTNQDANTVFLKVNSGICRMLSAITNLFVCSLLCHPAIVPLLIKARFLVSWKKWQLSILDGQETEGCTNRGVEKKMISICCLCSHCICHRIKLAGMVITDAFVTIKTCLDKFQ